MDEVAEASSSVERRPLAGSLAVLFAVVVWGAVTVVAKLVEGVDGLVLGFHRLWIGALVTVAVLFVRGKRLSWRQLRLCLPGGLAFGLDIVLFFSALKSTTVANATVIGALQPALVLLVVGRLFGEKVTRSAVAWTVVAIGGVAIVVFGSSATPAWSPRGDLLAAAALFAWTWYFVASKQARRDLDPLDFLAGMTLVAAVAVAPVALLSGQRLNPGGGGEWLKIAALAICSGGIGHLLLSWAHDHIELSAMSLLTLAVPVVATISGALFIHERIVLLQVVGMAVVLCALGTVVLREAGRAPAGLPGTPDLPAA